MKEDGSDYDLMHILWVGLERELRRKGRKSMMMMMMGMMNLERAWVLVMKDKDGC